MNDDPIDDDLASLLAEYDDALAAGSSHPASLQGELRSELAEVESVRRWLSPLSQPSPAGNPPWTRLGRFEIRRELGRGGCGIVYLAFDPTLGREVALKVPRAEVALTPELRERFHREARAAAGLEHPHIVPVYEVGEVGPVSFLVAAYCPGPTLADWLASQKKPVPFRAAAELVAAVADAVQHAHSHCVIHRDLKPANILLAGVQSPNADSLTPKVTDFGLAKRLGDDNQTRSGSLLGTVRYMAPEQAAGKSQDVGPAADVHALGAILYELLTRQPPFHGANDVDTLQQIRMDEPLPPARLRPGLPRDLAVICLRALAKLPARRYASAGALADDLRRFLKGEPICARPVGTIERIALWSRRRPVAAALLPVSALALGALIALAVGWVYHGRLSDAYALIQEGLESEKEARKEADQALGRVQTYDYHNRVLLAHSEWRDNRVGRAEEVLQGCPEPLRHWEWHYLQRLFHTGRQTLRGHRGKVQAVAFSPDGSRIASGGSEGTVIIWDATACRPLRTLAAHRGAVGAVAFSPDGKWLASGGTDKVVRLWDATRSQERLSIATSRQERLELATHSFGVRGLAFSPDGTRLATCCGDGSVDLKAAMVQVWNLADGREQRSLVAHGRGGARGVAFAPDGTWFASAGSDGVIKLWNAATGEERLTITHSASCNSVAISPDGLRLASASGDGSVRVWKTATGEAVFPLHGHTGSVTAVAFSPLGDRLASAGIDQTARVWDAASGRELFILKGHTSHVLAVAFRADGQRLASGGADTAVNVWESTAGQDDRFLMGHPSGVTGVAFSPDNRLLASSTFTERVKVWETATGRELRTLTATGAGQIRGVCFSPDGKHLACAGPDRTAHVWEVGSGRCVLELKDHPATVMGVAYLAGGRQIATIALDRTARLWDTETGHLVRTLPGGKNHLLGLAVSADSRWLAAGSGNGLLLWDLESQAPPRSLSGHRNTVVTVAFSPDGKHLASAGADSCIRVWSLATAEPARELAGHASNVGGLSWSPDSRRLVSSSSDGTLRLWDVANGQQALILDGHNGSVRAVAFSPDGQRVVSGGEDGTIRIWDGTPWVFTSIPERAGSVNPPRTPNSGG